MKDEKKEVPVEQKDDKACHPDVMCPICNVRLVPEHAHSVCPKCRYRDSCCF